ncbi:hypothetical protein EAF04_005879 [Stromatinia cepivora]|nr:hypothetical protein EAF04_005879 [Stromatinia cepivora]
MKNTKLVGLWEPDKRTWDEYKDTGLDCDAVVLRTAFRLMKDNPTGSDYALTTCSDTGTGDKIAGSRARTGTETRDGTESEASRTNRTDRDRSSNRRTDRAERDVSRDRRADTAPRSSKYSGKQIEASGKSSAQQSSASRDATRERRNPSSERGDSRGGGKSNTTSDRHERERRRSRIRQDPLPSSSPELPYRELPRPRQSDRRERDDTDSKLRRSDLSSRANDGKKLGVGSRGKDTATTGSSRKRADTTNSLSTRAPDSSGSDNQRQPSKKSSKTALRTSADLRKFKPEGSSRSERKPGGGSNAC